MRLRGSNDSGLTLAEMLVVLVLFGIIGSIVATAVIVSLRHQTQLENRNNALAQVRTAVDRIDRDIRSTSLNTAGTAPQLVVGAAGSSLAITKLACPAAATSPANTVSQTVTYSVNSANDLVVNEGDATLTGSTCTVGASFQKVLITNLVKWSTTPVFTAGSCTAANPTGCLVTVNVFTQPPKINSPVNLTDGGTALRNIPTS